VARTTSVRRSVWGAILAGLTLPLAWPAAGLAQPPAGTVQFSGDLLEKYPFLLTEQERTALDKIHRDLREAQQQSRKADNQAAREQAVERMTKAADQLVALIEKNANVKRLSLKDNKVTPPIHGPYEMVGDTGAFLFRVESGEGQTRFATYDINQSLPEQSKIVQMDCAPNGVTWVLLGLYNLPPKRITLPMEFLRQGVEPIRTLTEVVTPETGRLKLTVLSDETGKPTPAMIRVTSKATGRDRQPSNAVDVTGQFDGNGQNTSHRPANIPGRLSGQWWILPGPLDMALPPGQYEVAIRRGIEHTPIFDAFSVQSKEVTQKTYRIKRWIDMPKLGWYSGDDHFHGQILSDADATRLMAWLQAEDIHLGNIVEMGDIYRTYFEQRGFGKGYRVVDGDYILSPGQECPRTHRELGHTLSMNITSMVRDTDKYYLYDWVADTVHGQGGLWGYAHVNSGMFFVYRDMSINIPKNKCDFAEVLQFGNLGTEIWYEFLNAGFKVTASAGSDVPWGGTVGEVRLYAYTGKGDFSADAWFEAVRKGRTMVSNGPMLEFTVDSALPGDEIVVKENRKLHVKARALGQPEFSQPAVLKVIKFGEDVKTAKPAKPGDTEITLEFDIDAGDGFWLAAVTRATNGCHAHTTPIYVRREGLRFWKYDGIDELLDKRLDSLKQVEDVVAKARQKDPAVMEGNQELKQLVLQAPELLRRVEAARTIYTEFKQVAEKEKAMRGKS
jgi:hypothetical protein